MRPYAAVLWAQSMVCRALASFHRDERGADEGMNKLLIFGLVALPLLALLIFFGQDIVEKVTSAYDTVVGGGGVQGP